MKAWCVSDTDNEYGTEIVFAETRGKAKSLCMDDDVFEDCLWTDLRVKRFKEYDDYFDGKNKIDFWMEAEHRIRLVRDFGWTCMEPISEECANCPARAYCYKGSEEEI